MGFVLTSEEAHKLISTDSRNKDVLFPYLNGEDLNNDPQQKASRWVINFFDWSEEKARTYPDCFNIIERLVKPERQRWKLDKDGNEIEGVYALRKPLPQKWWIYSEKRPALYETISKLDQVMAINRYTKYLTLDFQLKNIVFSDSIVVLALNSYNHFSILSSVIHEMWSWKNCSTMGASTLRYSPTNALETFPFPMTNSQGLIEIGRSLDSLRKKIMTEANIGLTELYNMFHKPNLKADNVLQSDILHLRDLHRNLDKIVLEAYNWSEIPLMHDFYQMEYLPENDRIRLSVHPDARKEILKRLLAMNHKKYNEEIVSHPIAPKKGKSFKKAIFKTDNLFSTLEDH
jgi:hypothetical protein